MEHPARFKLVTCGRRWGKTLLGKNAILYQALRYQKRCWWLAPTYQMASQTWRDLKNDVRQLKGVAISESEKRIDLPGGGMIAVRSAHNPDNLRGDGIDFAVLDEAAYMRPSLWQNVIRPMLATTRGGALFLTTPNGRNWFWELFRLGLDPEEDEWQSFHHATADSPLVDEDELQSIRRITPLHIWESEYEAKFIESAAQVFRGVNDAAAPAPHNSPQPGHTYIAGIDWGRANDYTAIAVIDATRGQMVALQRFNHIGWQLQRDRIASLVQHWRPQIVWAEANSIGEANIEALLQDGLPIRPFHTTAKTKAPLIESLALAIERADITLLNDPVLIAELNAYSLEGLPNGSYRYSAPPGGHDDTVIATALAWFGTQCSGPHIAFA